MVKILIVEDDALSREMLTLRLQRRGFQVIAASDGRGGLDLAQAAGPDLIIMDMSLPNLDGFEVTRRLKAAAATRRIPVIALTAHAMAGDREKCLEAGCDDYESKPVDFALLVQKIRQWAAPEPPA